MTTHSPSFRIALLAVLLLTLLSAQSVSGTGGSRGDEAAIDAAAEEAQGWPNFDSTNLANQVLKVEQAKAEAEGWADYDPSNIAVTVALAPVANGPHDAAY